MEKQFYSNGKLLLSGEYVILNGAKALAIPVKFGQSMIINNKQNDDSLFTWETFVNGKVWFKTEIPKFVSDFPSTGRTETESWLLNLLYSAQHLAGENNPLEKISSITCKVNYDILWGLGSSSSLISNVAQLYNIDPFGLFQVLSDGSGYDVACAREKKPIFYQNNSNGRTIAPTSLSCKTTSYIYFVYSGRKQKTDKSIKKYKLQQKPNNTIIERISDISVLLTKADGYAELKDLVKEHEKIVGKILEEKPIKQKNFLNFDGELKSMGAWGGDFFMAVTNQGEKYVRDYFKSKNLNIIYRYENMILKNE